METNKDWWLWLPLGLMILATIFGFDYWSEFVMDTLPSIWGSGWWQ